jgi:hypothetical protein
MKTLLIALLVLACAVSAHAAPFLVCDPQENVAEYRVVVDGGEPIIVSYQEQDLADGRFAVLLDVADLEDGEHTYEVTAIGLWGREAGPVPFVYLKAPPGEPSGIDLHK